MLRVYDVASRRQIHAIYLKQRLNGLLLLADDDDDDDDLVDQPQAIDGDGETQYDSADDGVDVEDHIEDYVGSSNDELESGDSEDEANPFKDDVGDDDDDDDDEEASPHKKRRT
jgi:hypothetical protein